MRKLLVAALVAFATALALAPFPPLAVGAAASDCVTSTFAGDRKCLAPKDHFKDCADCPEMVVIPAGTFTMGSPETEAERAFIEGPQHEITIAKPFAAGRFEVTYAEWDACTADGGCRKARDPGWGRDRHPVVNVSWVDVATQYLPWLSAKAGRSYRMLSEAEWEYAARAGSTTPFSMGETISTEIANYDGSSTPYGSGKAGAYRKKSLDVGSFPPNAFDLHDMHGNVAEWVADCYADSYTGAPSDGRPRAGGGNCSRILRGGSWIDAPRALRSAYRGHVFANSRFIYRGFRVACDLL